MSWNNEDDVEKGASRGDLGAISTTLYLRAGGTLAVGLQSYPALSPTRVTHALHALKEDPYDLRQLSTYLGNVLRSTGKRLGSLPWHSDLCKTLFFIFFPTNNLTIRITYYVAALDAICLSIVTSSGYIEPN